MATTHDVNEPLFYYEDLVDLLTCRIQDETLYALFSSSEHRKNNKSLFHTNLFLQLVPHQVPLLSTPAPLCGTANLYCTYQIKKDSAVYDLKGCPIAQDM